MSSRKKLTLAMVSLVLVIVALVVALTTVLAAQTQVASTGDITVTYHATQVEATVSAKYVFLDVSDRKTDGTMNTLPTMSVTNATPMKNGSNESISFTAGQNQTTATLAPTSTSMTFGENTDLLLFEYTFKNNDSVSKFNAALTMGSAATLTNVTLEYATAIDGTYTAVTTKTSGTAIGSAVTVNAGATVKYYVRAYVKDIDIDAKLVINFKWTLTNV